MNEIWNVKCSLLVVTCMFTSYGCPTLSFEEVRRTELLWLEPTIPESRRVVTVMNYNVLAQDLITAHPHLYRAHNPENLLWGTRKNLLMNEFLRSEADIIALQEVQESHLDLFYNNLEHYGYKGFFKKRTCDKSDGCALYYKVDVFDLIHLEEVEFQQPGVKNLNKPNVAIIAKLKHRSNNRELIIANTHLLFTPKRADVRLAQMQVLLAELHRIASSSVSPAVMLVGDLNSRPDAPIIRLLEEGSYVADQPVIPDDLGILPSCVHESNSKLYNSKMILSIFEDDDRASCQASETIQSDPSSATKQGKCARSSEMDRQHYLKTSQPKNYISHAFNFSSTFEFYDLNNRAIATTYQDRWLTVDYMFHSNMIPFSRQRLPTVEECMTYVGRIPSSISPSDHLPLLASYLL